VSTYLSNVFIEDPYMNIFEKSLQVNFSRDVRKRSLGADMAVIGTFDDVATMVVHMSRDRLMSTL
jgi:hypothetical protein